MMQRREPRLGKDPPSPKPKLSRLEQAHQIVEKYAAGARDHQEASSTSELRQLQWRPLSGGAHRCKGARKLLKAIQANLDLLGDDEEAAN